MASRHERLAENQRIVRGANERLEELIHDRADGANVPFLCECADEYCLGRVDLSTADYYAIHVDRSQYVIVDGHPRISGELVIEQVDGYQIVRKP